LESWVTRASHTWASPHNEAKKIHAYDLIIGLKKAIKLAAAVYC